MDEAEQLCDRLVVMDKAKIVAEGSAARADRAATRRARSPELRFAPACQETLDGQLDGIAERIERLADRVLLYADDGEAAAVAVHAARVSSPRRSSSGARRSRTSSCG